jgi:UDP-glucose 4-epimerase
MGVDRPVEHGPARAVNDVRRRLASTTAAAELLDFQAEVGLEDGLRALVDWWQREQAQLAGVSA